MLRNARAGIVRRLVPTLLFVFSLAVLGGATCAGGSDDVRRIGAVQGPGHTSPLVDTRVTVQGVVTAVLDDGLVVQDPQGDGDEATSEALTVRAPVDGLRRGNAVRVTGTVAEETPGGRDTNLTTTTITDARVDVLELSTALPEPAVLGRGGRALPTAVVDDDALTSFDPDRDGIDFFESLEGMLVRIERAFAVSATSRYGELWVLADGGMDATSRNLRGGVTLTPTDDNPERIQLDDTLFEGSMPAAEIGDVIESVVGIVGYDYGNYDVMPLERPSVARMEAKPAVAKTPPADDDALTVATFNILNLGGDEPYEEFEKRARVIVHALHAPALVALQEVQDDDGPADTGSSVATGTFRMLIEAIERVGGPRYEFAQIDPVDGADGGQPGGNIRNGFLYDPTRITLVEREGESPMRLAPDHEAFRRSRVPLVATFEWKGRPLVVVNVHLSSKGGSTPLFGSVRPPVNGSLDRRVVQAGVVRDHVTAVRASDPRTRVIVLGDFNEFAWNEPLQRLTADGLLENLILELPEAERATYVYQGNAQALDHVLVSDGFASAEVEVVHANTARRDAASDHDPVLVRLR